MSLFTNYNDWRNTMIKNAGLTLDHDYCTERIAALQDEGNPTTKSFLKAYGANYRDQVIAWFQQALSEQK